MSYLTLYLLTRLPALLVASTIISIVKFMNEYIKLATPEGAAK